MAENHTDELVEKAIKAGYTGDKCSNCKNYTMVRENCGTKCDTCGHMEDTSNN